MIFQNSSPWVSHVFYTDTFPFLPLFHFFFSFFYSTFFIFLVSEPFIWFFFWEKVLLLKATETREYEKREKYHYIALYCLFSFLSVILLLMYSLKQTLFLNYYFCSRSTFPCKKLILTIVPKKTLPQIRD